MRSDPSEFHIPVLLFLTRLHLPGIKFCNSRLNFPTASKPILNLSFHTVPLGTILGNSPFTLPLVACFPEVMSHTEYGWGKDDAFEGGKEGQGGWWETGNGCKTGEGHTSGISAAGVHSKGKSQT
ncbi:hypothetical protein M404DRAFT_31603 [Pisolithus tinctorius Marx 270]|uniref:Uncharacterized protein n=1 Tax=Pisolithus tinctorius Marx 270 TaxID=870435 RepID=A0A0C3IMT3_PISTI|nr:hypothetical protein M404DRAFT_31603 [Pisolithus tinctorius Marx 270]